MADTVAIIEQRIQARQFTQHVVVNVAKLIEMRKNAALAESVTQCDIINIDGAGILLGAKFLGHEVSERVAGIDLFCELLKMSEGNNYPIFLLGAAEQVVQSAAKAITALHPKLRIAGYHHGYFWEHEKAVVDKIRQSGARLLFVAITSPKKENFISRWRDDLGVDFVMGVGGTFDVIAGKVKRAPLWMQKAGLEWLYRLMQEPRRMWKRYLLSNAAYVILLLKAKLFRSW